MLLHIESLDSSHKLTLFLSTFEHFSDEVNVEKLVKVEHALSPLATFLVHLESIEAHERRIDTPIA